MPNILPRLPGYEVAVTPTDPKTDPSAYIAAKSLWLDTSLFPPTLKVRDDTDSFWLSAGTGGVPTEVGETQTLYVPAKTQLLFSEEIDLADGAELDVDGVLVEVQ